MKGDANPKMSSNAIIIESQYAPSIGWLALARRSRVVRLDASEHYQKGSLRNKTLLRINGEQAPLTVPLTKGKHGGVSTAAVKIHQDGQWPSQHLRSIRMAYGKAPYFIHFIDEIEAILMHSHDTIWSLNLGLIEWLNTMLELDLTLERQEAFIRASESDACCRDQVRFKGDWSPTEEQLGMTWPSVAARTHLPYVPSVRESGLTLLFYLGRETRIVLDQWWAGMTYVPSTRLQ